jgi:hypothetical protein
MQNKKMDIAKLNIIFATRDMARFVIKSAIDENYNEISFENVQSTSRSFLDELFVLSKKNNIKIVNIPETILPLYNLIARSYRDNKIYAPEIKVQVSNKTFA